MTDDHGSPTAAGMPRRPLSRRRVLGRAGMLLAGAAAAALWPPGRASASPGEPSGQSAGLDLPAGAVPGLDELAGAWMPAGTLLNLPSVNNFHGGLHAGSNLLAVTELTFPPLSLGGVAARLALNGVNVQAHESRWYPYQVLRRASMGDFLLESAVRMGFEAGLVLLVLDITNTGPGDATASVEVDLGGYLRSYPGPWSWAVPRQYSDFSAWQAQLADSDRVAVVTDSASGAATAFGFPAPPDELALTGGSGTAAWQLPLRPGERRAIQIVLAAADSADRATAAAAAGRDEFAAVFWQAKAGWEERFSAAFTPGNGHFSGSLPVLVTGDQPLSSLYYGAVASLLALERTCYPQYFPRVYVTAGPQWGVTLSYFWDTSLFAPLLVLLDPEMAREQARRWLELGIYDGYAVDALTGQLSGVWYSANDLSVFSMVLSYLQLSGDLAFLDEQAGSASVIDQLQAIALHWQQLAVPATGLADYGGESNLLEEVPSYVNQVPSLNAGNVWMMRELAALRELRGELAAAQQLTELAGQLAARVLGLYVPGQGVWQTVHDDGTRAAVRHVYDFDVIGRLLTDDLTPAMRDEMGAFVTGELLAGGWMRALSLSDPDAAVSLRPDHGSNGAYDAWPALAASAMGRCGHYGEMLGMLRTFAGVGAEGPFAQSHELVPQPSGLVVWDRADLNPVEELTVAAWIRPVSWPAAHTDGSIVAKDSTAGAWYPTTPPNVGYALRGGAGGVISFTVATGASGFPAAVSTAVVPPGGWHHVAGTYDGHRLTVYIDGQPAAAAAAAGPIRPSTGTNVMVGADPVNPVRKFTGAIDEARIYSRALSPAEITGLYAASDPGYGAGDPALVLLLPMDEGSGSRTADAVTGLAETLAGGDWVPGRHGSALSFTASASLTARVSRQQYNENNGAAFAVTILQDLFGYQPGGRGAALRDPAASRGISARLHGVTWRGRRYTITSTPAGLALSQGR